MWNLLKNDVSYHSMILTSIIVLSFQLILYSIAPFYKNINLVVLMLFSIVIISTMIERNKTGIERQNSLLPLSDLSIGTNRSLLLLSPWLFLIVGLILFNLILFPSLFNEVFTLIGQLGFTLILVSGYVILQDIYLSHSVNRRYERIFRLVLYFLLIIISSMFVLIVADSFNAKLMTGNGILIIYLWGILLTFLTILSFARRKSYL